MRGSWTVDLKYVGLRRREVGAQYDKIKLAKDGNGLFNSATIPFKMLSFYDIMYNKVSMQKSLQRFFEISFQDFIFKNGIFDKVPILRHVLNVGFPTKSPTPSPVSIGPSLVFICKSKAAKTV